MPYNSASAGLVMQPNGQQGYSSAPGPWQNQPFPQSAVADPYAGNTYTGNQTYTPPPANPQDYWNETTSSYDQMPKYGEGGYEPYDAAGQYQPSYIDPSMAPNFANVNTYAPWSNPYGPGGVESANQAELMQDPAFFNNYKPASGGESMFDNSLQAGAAGGAMGLGTGAAMYGAGYGTGLTGMAGVMGSGLLGPAGLAGAGLAYGLDKLGAFNKKKKRQAIDFSSPSYQGYMFTPEEGFPEYYNPSQETQNMSQQDLYSQTPDYSGDLGLASPQTTGTNSYDYNYGGGDNFQQNYVGQQDYNYGSLYDNNNSLYNTFQPSAL